MKKKYPSIREIREAHSWKRNYERFLPVSRFIFRPVSFLVTWLAIRLGLTSEAVSWLSGVVGLTGCIFLTSRNETLLVAGIGLLLLFNLLDCVDGSIARTMKTENPYGRFLDSVCGGIVDLIFWGVIGVLAFRHQSLTVCPDILGYRSLFWLILGCVTSYLYIFLGYLEQTFDELLRVHWQKFLITKNKSARAFSMEDNVAASTDTQVNAVLRTINNNLRVRETHYLLLIFAFWLKAIDILLFTYFFYYLSQNIVLLVAYSRRGRIIKIKHPL